MITIKNILNFGRTWTVKLSCGCNRRGLTSEEIKREQLFIGKAVECPKHGGVLRDIDRIAERIEVPPKESAREARWAEIKNGAGEVTGYIELFWGGDRCGWVSIPGASRVIEAGSGVPS